MSKESDLLAQLEKKYQNLQLENARLEERKKQLQEENTKLITELNTLGLTELDLEMTIEELKTKLETGIAECQTLLNN